MKIKKELFVTEQDKIDLDVERCVMCGGETEYTSSVPISQRNYYVEGAGQICEKCYRRLYVKNYV